MVTRLESARSVTPRTALPGLSFDLVGGLVATAGAAVVYVGAVRLGRLPPDRFAGVLFAAAPLLAAVAWPVLTGRARREQDLRLRWLAAGLGVAMLAMLAQLVSLPFLVEDGGLLGTDGQGSAALYLLFHLTLYASALAGGSGVAPGWIRPFVVVAALWTAAIAVNAVPLPALLRPGQVQYTGLLVGLEWCLVAVGAIAVWRWVRSSRALPGSRYLAGWAGISLSVSVYELALNAVAARRFDDVWWASLSLRVAGFAVLAYGCQSYLLRQLSRVETYTQVELDRREGELGGTVRVVDQLLSSAAGLSSCTTTDQVATVLQDAATAVVGDADIQVWWPTPTGATPFTSGMSPTDQPIHPRPAGHQGGPARPDLPLGGLSLAGHVPLPGLADLVIAHDAPLSAESSDASTWTRYDLEAAAPLQAGAVAVPLRVDRDPVGALVVAAPEVRRWSPAQWEFLIGLADQAGPALFRARASERDRAEVEALQWSLLPGRLPQIPGMSIAARYRPATQGHQVGGDWYDAWTVGERQVALVVGDVVGKGLRAAGTMGRLRSGLRALAQADPSPGRVLSLLDEWEAQEGAQMAATILYVLLDLDKHTAQVARAGHVPLMIARPGSPPELILQAGSAPIGVNPQPVNQTTIQAPPGSTLLLFTDGLVEERTYPLDVGLARISQIATDVLARDPLPADPTATIADALMSTAPQGDDAALLMAQL